MPRLSAELQAVTTESAALAREAGQILRDNFRAGQRIRMKGVADVVTATDLAVQRMLTRRLTRRFPAHGILAEEGVDTRPAANGRWILDPLDGTKNFARGHPYFCVSIAWQQHGETTVGTVYDPLHDELFAAVRGHGARCNGRLIRVSRTAELPAAFLGTGCPRRVRKFVRPVTLTFGRMASRALGVRFRGASALDLCYVACGRLDGYWELDQSPWDVAAGALIVEEAGGRVSNFRGGGFDIFAGQTVAGNPLIQAAMLRVLRFPGSLPRRYSPPVSRPSVG